MSKKRIVIAVAGVAAVLCVGCFALTRLAGTRPVSEATATTAAEPAEPPPPTDTPAPSPTATPAVLTVGDIEKKRKELTDLQWEGYSQGLVGEPIRFAGEVLEVRADGRVQISEGKGLLTGCVLHGISLDVAAALDKDQFVQGVGTVRDVDTLLGLRVHIEVESLE